MSEENKPFEGDWELSEDYYEGAGEERAMSLDDFILPSSEPESSPADLSKAAERGMDQEGYEGRLLKKTIEDVRRVMELSLKGNDIGRIAAITGLEKPYVYNILVCAQGFREDDEIAVAHLVLG